MSRALVSKKKGPSSPSKDSGGWLKSPGALKAAERKASAHSLKAPGAQLKELRIRRGWTLAEVSEKTGLPPPTLSKLENNKMSLTYDKLIKLSRGLEVDVAELLAATPAAISAARIVGRRSVSRAGEGVTVRSGTYVYQHLATDLLNKAYVPMIGEIKARTLEEFGEMIKHPGEEFVYVLKGILELHTSLYAPVILHEGDSIFFDSDMAHAYVAAGAGLCKVLSICSD